MKHLLTLLSVAVLSFTANGAEWLSDYPTALAKARASGKPVLIDFTGSDWCPYCIELKKNALSTGEFESFADQNLILVEVDFPRRKKLPAQQLNANEALARRFGIEGFPTLVLVNGEGKVLGRVPSVNNPAGLIQEINRISGHPNPPSVAKAKQEPSGPPPPMFNGAPTQPPPQYAGLKLQGISGPPGKRLAILNSQTFSKGEGGKIKISGKEIEVRCLEIRDHSVLLAIEGNNKEVFGSW
ncbi:MAG TPA: thioredoxin family protein [Candidatus Saccharimonadales bacterium]|nr:thioredoxin family protein [Candidatus Saccharimonadales bacterium]